MNLRGLRWAPVVVLWSLCCPAQTLRWDAGPALRLKTSEVLTLQDGRLLVCPAEATAACEIVDPLTAKRHVVARPVGNLREAVPIEGSSVLLRSGERLDLQRGDTQSWPAAPADLAAAYAQPLSNGRAAFWMGEGAPLLCGSVTFFVGGQQGFHSVPAAQTGSCVAAVFELGSDEVFVARRLSGGRPGISRYDVVRLNLLTWTWQGGPLLGERRPVAALRHGDGFAVLQMNGEGGLEPALEALFLNAAGEPLRTTKVMDFRPWPQPQIRAFGDALLILEPDAVTRWSSSTGELARVERNAPPLQYPWIAEREGKFVLIDREGYNATYALVEAEPSTTTPCAAAFDYTLNTMRSGRRDALEGSRLRELTTPQCNAWLDAGGQLPETITRAVDALTQRVGTPSSPEEEQAAFASCALLPISSAAQLARLSRSDRLGYTARQVCLDAADLMSVLLAAKNGRGLSNALLRAGLPEGTDRLRPRAIELLESRKQLRKASGPLLLAAKERRAMGFDALFELLCSPVADAALASACASASMDNEQRWNAEAAEEREFADHAKIVRNFGIATAVFGGLGSLAYLDRNGPGGRFIAVGSGVAAGGVLGGFATLSTASASKANGYAAVFLAIPITILGGIAGGLITAHTSAEAGDARFASAAVPLGGLWLFSAGIAIDKW